MDAETKGMTPELLRPDIIEAIAAIDYDVKRLMPQHGENRLPSIYEILDQTPAQGTDLARSLRSAMFGNGYMLSHERRLLAIVIARALQELASQSSRIEELERDAARLDWLEHHGSYVSRFNDQPEWESHVIDRNGEHYGATPRDAIDAARTSLSGDADRGALPFLAYDGDLPHG